MSEGNVKYAAKLLPFYFHYIFCVCVFMLLLLLCCCSFFYWSWLFQHKLHMFTFFSFGYNDLINFQVLTFQAFSLWRFWSNDPFYTQLFFIIFSIMRWMLMRNCVREKKTLIERFRWPVALCQFSLSLAILLDVINWKLWMNEKKQEERKRKQLVKCARKNWQLHAAQYWMSKN